MKLKEIKKQSEFCTELMRRVNDDVQKSHIETYSVIKNHTQIVTDIIRLRRELNDLNTMVNTWGIEE